MYFDDVVEIVKPDQHSQFRLSRCSKCDTDENVVYMQHKNADGSLCWSVKCLTCGSSTRRFAIRHDAQIRWNGVPWKMPPLPKKSNKRETPAGR